jgi:hypothetical protein
MRGKYPALLSAGSQQGKTAALPVIWERVWDDFHRSPILQWLVPGAYKGLSPR